MTFIRKHLDRTRGVLGSEDGQGMVEYGLIIALIVIVVMVALTPLGKDNANIFTGVSNSI